MNKIENEKKIAETVRLYESEGLVMKQIAERLKITPQAVLYRLKTAGVKFRPKRYESRVIALDHDVLIRLYVNNGLSVNAVAKRLNVSPNIVSRELERYSIERRPIRIENRKPTPLDTLEVNESVLIPARGDLYVPLYKMAAVRKIRIRVTRIDPDHVRVTRVSTSLKGRYPSPLDALLVGEATIIAIEDPNRKYKNLYRSLYDQAITKGMKVSIHRLDEQTVKITRTK